MSVTLSPAFADQRFSQAIVTVRIVCRNAQQ
jgi:hypothetical protein